MTNTNRIVYRTTHRNIKQQRLDDIMYLSTIQAVNEFKEQIKNKMGPLDKLKDYFLKYEKKNFLNQVCSLREKMIEAMDNYNNNFIDPQKDESNNIDTIINDLNKMSNTHILKYNILEKNTNTEFLFSISPKKSNEKDYQHSQLYIDKDGASDYSDLLKKANKNSRLRLLKKIKEKDTSFLKKIVNTYPIWQHDDGKLNLVLSSETKYLDAAEYTFKTYKEEDIQKAFDIFMGKNINTMTNKIIPYLKENNITLTSYELQFLDENISNKALDRDTSFLKKIIYIRCLCKNYDELVLKFKEKYPPLCQLLEIYKETYKEEDIQKASNLFMCNRKIMTDKIISHLKEKEIILTLEELQFLDEKNSNDQLNENDIKNILNKINSDNKLIPLIEKLLHERYVEVLFFVYDKEKKYDAIKQKIKEEIMDEDSLRNSICSICALGKIVTHINEETLFELYSKYKKEIIEKKHQFLNNLECNNIILDTNELAVLMENDYKINEDHLTHLIKKLHNNDFKLTGEIFHSINQKNVFYWNIDINGFVKTIVKLREAGFSIDKETLEDLFIKDYPSKEKKFNTDILQNFDKLERTRFTENKKDIFYHAKKINSTDMINITICIETIESAIGKSLTPDQKEIIVKLKGYKEFMYEVIDSIKQMKQNKVMTSYTLDAIMKYGLQYINYISKFDKNAYSKTLPVFSTTLTLLCVVKTIDPTKPIGEQDLDFINKIMKTLRPVKVLLTILNKKHIDNCKDNIANDITIKKEEIENFLKEPHSSSTKDIENLYNESEVGISILWLQKEKIEVTDNIKSALAEAANVFPSTARNMAHNLIKLHKENVDVEPLLSALQQAKNHIRDDMVSLAIDMKKIGLKQESINKFLAMSIEKVKHLDFTSIFTYLNKEIQALHKKEITIDSEFLDLLSMCINDKDKINAIIELSNMIKIKNLPANSNLYSFLKKCLSKDCNERLFFALTSLVQEGVFNTEKLTINNSAIYENLVDALIYLCKYDLLNSYKINKEDIIFMLDELIKSENPIQQAQHIYDSYNKYNVIQDIEKKQFTLSKANKEDQALFKEAIEYLHPDIEYDEKIPFIILKKGKHFKIRKVDELIYHIDFFYDNNLIENNIFSRDIDQTLIRSNNDTNKNFICNFTSEEAKIYFTNEINVQKNMKEKMKEEMKEKIDNQRNNAIKKQLLNIQNIAISQIINQVFTEQVDRENNVEALDKMNNSPLLVDGKVDAATWNKYYTQAEPKLRGLLLLKETDKTWRDLTINEHQEGIMFLSIHRNNLRKKIDEKIDMLKEKEARYDMDNFRKHWEKKEI